ncbi:HEAT repeat domain-containing protein [Halopiger xanaduensis]|uniref:HEAT domain containing protein n=1 Tax=Halopiger xanaduensis (strain DSM 18323 / JCM 14033 / SH-6) TaxID=797210 RepID=F8D9Q3_HALXS|nr:HEAT repeat domain-containing protein [Halopiger xanaduensis]AEH37575.1 HEAT domain containing protein [Halopiger xanaduensis SH-6]
MDGDGGEGSAQLHRSADSHAAADSNSSGGSSSSPTLHGDADAEFNLPAVLAQLDATDADVQRQAVRTIRAHVDDRPEACIPTVSKLRTLLERPDLEYHEAVAYCLAELAEESAADVAPSADEIVSFATERPSHPATADCCRSLAAIADERPGALVDRVDALVPTLESDDATVRANAALALARVADGADGPLEQTDTPDVLEDVRAILADLERTDPDPDVREWAAQARDRLR